MIIFACLILSCLYSVKNKSFSLWSVFNIIVIAGLGLYCLHGIDVLYKADLNKPSDTAEYYFGFMSDIKDIKTYIFYQYPLLLKIISFPFNHAIYAAYGQALIIYWLLDFIVKNKSDLLLFIFNHAFIFTVINLFKDNFIFIVALTTFILLRSVTNNLLQSLIVLLSFIVLSWIRPFFYLLFPIAFFPVITKIESKKIKILICLILVLVSIGVIVTNLHVINYVIQRWATDASVQETKSGPIVALIKVFLGPTPFHYLFHDKHFVQPILDSHGIMFFILHFAFYFTFAFFVAHVVSNRKRIFNEILHARTEILYMLVLSLFLLCVYVLAYGSADIRQRALIISFLYLFVIAGDNSVVRKLTDKETINYMFVAGAALLITCLSY